jgi:hypothetical protein
MNANELTFGVEIETTVPDITVRRENLRIGLYHNGMQVPYLPQGWKAEQDGSLRTPSNHKACEIVSPILKGDEGIRQVIEVLRILNEKGHNVNDSCGVHVHVFFDPTWPADKLAKLISIVSYLEQGIYATTGTKKRERGTYCKGLRKYGDQPKAKQKLDPDRYHLLNITNLTRRMRPTVEFRAFSGSLSATKIIGWIQLCLGIVERALEAKRLPTWQPKPVSGGWKKDGIGQSEVERLLGFLKWGDGYRRLNDGKQYGWVSDAIPQDEVKKELRRLAKKYDAEV